MKFRFLILIMFLAVIAQPAGPQQANGQLGKDQVMDLMKAGMETPELVKLIHEHGIDFDLSDDYLQALRNAGAQDPVIQALRAARPKPLNKEQVLQLLAGHVPSQRAATLVKQHGIDFLPDERYLATLRLAGADDTLITALREASKGGRVRVRVNPKDGLEYVWIPPGIFLMGCSPDDKECLEDEEPRHQVRISKGFWLGQTEVTVEAYKRFVGATGREMPPDPTFNSAWANDHMPIVYVNWNDAHDYCTWAGGRLPTEAEWEYAARAGSAEARYGDIDAIAWYDGNSGKQTHEVAQKRANGFGLFDVLGNVWEFINDWYEGKYYQDIPPQDPSGPPSGQFRVLRGEAWDVDPRVVRVSHRAYFEPADRGSNFGFRCAAGVAGP